MGPNSALGSALKKTLWWMRSRARGPSGRAAKDQTQAERLRGAVAERGTAVKGAGPSLPSVSAAGSPLKTQAVQGSVVPPSIWTPVTWPRWVTMRSALVA